MLDSHLEACAECRTQAATLAAIGGALIDETEPVALARDAWTHTLARVDAPVRDPDADRGSSRSSTASATLRLPPGMRWPRSLRRCAVSRWRWLGPGMRYARVTSRDDPRARLFLLRIGEGRSLPRHTHTGVELTQVLYGAFDDGRAVFGPGDFDAAATDVHHQPVVRRGTECICLASVEGSLRFDGRLASAIGGWIGM